MTNPVDLDDTGSWPADVRRHVLERATGLRGSTSYAGDLDIGLDGDTRFDEAMAGELLLAYHCTRLLPHEAEDIRRDGLRLLDQDLTVSRIQQAEQHGHLSPEQAEELLANTVFARHDTRGRLGQICAVVGRNGFNHDISGVWPLLNTWGGEAIYWAHDRKPSEIYLRQLGTPSIVVISLDLEQPSADRRHSFFPDLEKAFVGRVLNLDGVGSSAHYRAPVSPEHVLDIWQPGSDEYDRHRELPE